MDSTISHKKGPAKMLLAVVAVEPRYERYLEGIVFSETGVEMTANPSRTYPSYSATDSLGRTPNAVTGGCCNVCESEVEKT